MKNYLGPIIFASAATLACSGAKLDPDTAPVTVQLQEPSKNVPDIAPETNVKKPGKPEPVIEITKEMRWRLHNTQCSRRNWDTCGKEVNELFFELTKKIPRDVDRKCREDGDYTPGCVEKAYEQHVGNDALLQEYLSKEAACTADYNQCTTSAEDNCDRKCWTRIKEEVENERKKMLELGDDPTAPNP